MLVTSILRLVVLMYILAIPLAITYYMYMSIYYVASFIGALFVFIGVVAIATILAYFTILFGGSD